MGGKSERKPNGFDVLAWDKSTPNAMRSGALCRLCESHPAAEQIAAIVAAIDDGTIPNRRVRSMLPWLESEHGIKVSPGVLWHHVREHVRGDNRRE